MNDDPATVLEQFIHDVANLPAEIQHLLEEVEAKDKLIAECRTSILQRDNAIQRHIKNPTGNNIKHPKEEQFNKTVMANFEKAQALQNEKCALVEKAALLLDRHVKRLDIKIRDLQSEGSLSLEPLMPSLLVDSAANLVPPLSASSTGVNTPLQSSFMGSSTNIANAAVLRMMNVNANAGSNRASPGAGSVAGLAPHPLLTSNLAGGPQRQRETSASATSDGKKRKLNANLGSLPSFTYPAPGGRASSLGPGTPKALTPGSRAMSAGPRTKKPSKLGGSQQSQDMRKRLVKGASKKKGVRIKGMRGSPSTTDNESALSEVSNSDDENTQRALPGTDGAADDEYADEEGYNEDNDDGQVYCTCRTKGEGDMVACDNQKCEIEWFHFGCVGLTQIPKGLWLCPVCRTLDKSQVKIARNA